MATHVPTGSRGNFDSVNGTASPPVHLSYPSSHLQRTTREHFDPNVLGSTEVSAVPAKVVDSKTGVEEPLLVHGVNVPASGPQNIVHLLPTDLAEMRLSALGAVLTVFSEKDWEKSSCVELECATTPLVRDDSASAR